MQTKNKFCMQIFFGNLLLEYKIQFAVEKKIGAISKLFGTIFAVSVRKMLVIQFRYMEII